jgi:hypothetical protein
VVIPSHIKKSLFEEEEGEETHPEVEQHLKKKPKLPMEEYQILESCINTLEQILSSYKHFFNLSFFHRMEVLSLGLMISFLNQISYFVVSNL